MSLRARLALVKDVPAGQGVSYAHAYTTPVATTLGLVPLGYADGVPRAATSVAEVFADGRRLTIAGTVCMDQFVLDLGPDSDAAAGDDVVLGPGDVAAALRGTAHGYRNDGATEPARALCLYTPAGYEQYFRDVHAAVAGGDEPTDDLLAGLRARYDTTTS